MEDVANKSKTTKMLGGITGKGFMPGKSGNPSGRPKTPLKDYQRAKFAAMSDEEKEAFLADIDAKTKWAMAEGNPSQESEIKQAQEDYDLSSEEEQKRAEELKEFRRWKSERKSQAS